MRTKVLLSAVALVAACAFTAKAQNVYSLNVVGYINIPVMDNWNLCANQSDLDGTGVNNTVVTVLGSTFAPNGMAAGKSAVGTVVNTWDIPSQSFNVIVYSQTKGGTQFWNPTNAMNPGSGFWIQFAPGTFGSGVTGSVTTVGQVLQGNLTNSFLQATPAGKFALLGNIVPIAGGLTTTLNYQPTVGDVANTWDPSPAPVGQQFTLVAVYSQSKGGVKSWQPAEPVLQVGQGFWFQPQNAGPIWSTNFTVQ